MVFFWAVNASAGTYSGGDGSEEFPYRIATPNDLNEIGANPNDWDANFVLAADINLADYTGTQFNIIGNHYNPFMGIFDGNGHTISNFTYESTDTDCLYIAIFGYINDSNAEIKDLTLLNANANAAGESGFVGSLVGRLDSGTISGCAVVGGRVSGYQWIGGLVGCNRLGTISDCYSTGSVSGKQGAGGLVGENWGGTISNCYDTGPVEGVFYVGGLVGWNDGNITDCCATGGVTGQQNAGGLVGDNGGQISNCYATGGVSGGDFFTGGLAGGNAGTILNCYATGDVSGDCSIGGLVGNNGDGTISNCHATGAVDGNSRTGGLVGEIDGGVISSCYATGSVTGDWRTGGLAGDNAGTILNCYETGDITGEYWWAGGLVGDNYYGTIENCYATGSVTGGWDVGGLVGDNCMGDPVLDSFWDVETTGQEESDGGEGKTTAEMKKESTFTNAGWDFIEIWNIGENQTYPYLRVYPAGDIDHDDKVNLYDLAITAEHWLEGTEH